jgi:MoaA/NifB/PqqE/SkfB family radical SAM enzyme
VIFGGASLKSITLKKQEKRHQGEGYWMKYAQYSINRIGKTVWRSLPRNFILRNRPFFAHMVMTKRCNLRCTYCKAWQMPPNPNELSTSEWLKVIDNLDELGVYVLSFTGGEPLLKPGVFDMIEHARSRGLYTRLTSNGTLRERLYERLLDSDVNSISISLDSIEPHTQDGLSGVEGSWAKAVDTLEFLLANARPRKVISVSAMITPHNVHEIIPLVDFCSNDLQCPVFLQPVIFGPMSDATGDEPCFRPGYMPEYALEALNELHRKLCRKLLDSKLITPYTFLLISRKYLRTGSYKWKCKAGRLFFDIMPDGRFHLCQDVAFPEDGYAHDDDFVSCFRSEFWQESAKKLCAECVGCCYSCYVCSQYLFSWRLLDIVGVGAKSIYI